MERADRPFIHPYQSTDRPAYSLNQEQCERHGNKMRVCFVYHMNPPSMRLGYAECGPDDFAKIDQGYLEMLEHFAKYPPGSVLLECTGYGLKRLAKRTPKIIEKMRELIASGTAQIALGMYTNPLVQHMDRRYLEMSYDRSLEVINELFGVKPEDAFSQEYMSNQLLYEILAKRGIKRLIGWDEHIALGLPPDERDAYLNGGFINPVKVGTRSGDLHLVPFSGTVVIDAHWRMKDEGNSPQKFVQTLEKLSKGFNHSGTGICYIGADAEVFSSSFNPLPGKPPVTPESSDELFYAIMESDHLQFGSAADAIAKYKDRFMRTVVLPEGGSRKDLDPWTAVDKTRKNPNFRPEHIAKCDEFLRLLNQAEEIIMRNPDNPLLKRQFARAQEYYLLARSSDNLGYNPSDFREAYGRKLADVGIALCEKIIKSIRVEEEFLTGSPLNPSLHEIQLIANIV